MKRLRLAVVTLFAMVSLAGAATTGARAESPQPQPLAPTCTVTADNPHYSSGASGVIHKARFTCSGTATQFYDGVQLNLWRCTSKPTAWPGNNSTCVARASSLPGSIVDGGGSVSVGAGETVTVYNPPVGNPGVADAGGYWVGTVKYSFPGTSSVYRRCSQAVKGPLKGVSDPPRSSLNSC